jgi:hypothetical protein
VPAVLSLLREHQPLTPSNLVVYYFDIFDRVAGRSVQDNIWLVSYAQQNGSFGVAGIPVLARIAGVEPVNIFNLVGLQFLPNGIQSVSANASFPATNYACFGPGALGLSLTLTFLMDALLLLHFRLPRHLLIPCCGICAIISMNFAMTMFTTVFISHGLVFTIITCHALNLSRRFFRARPPEGAGPVAAEAL